ncbi:MAG: aminotransferase class V-fold PLP-dependent enzyme [Thermomicrobiales bacterium]
MSVYERLGLPTVINADATLTRLGGSLMPPEVVEAMQEASRNFVDLNDLQRAVGDRIASITNNEAAYVTSGAAAGLYLSTLACGLTTDAGEGMTILGRDRHEVVIHASQRNAYVPSIELAGATVVEIGDQAGATSNQLDEAIGDATLAVFYFAGAHFADGAIPVEEAIGIAHARGVPVVVDAAAQLPPPENLWRFTRDLGADLAVFSGGKGLRGPQSSGLILGRKDLVEVARAHGAPNQQRGRAMKVGKEEMLGLLAAVERYLRLDQRELSERYEYMVQTVLDAVAEVPGVTGSRDWPSEAGQPIPRARVTVGSGARAVQEALWSRNPRIAVAVDGDAALLVNPETLNPGEEIVVAERLVVALESLQAESE